MKPFTLVNETVSHDTIEALEFLLQEARSGELIGLAYGAMLKRRTCIVDYSGRGVPESTIYVRCGMYPTHISPTTGAVITKSA